MVGKTRTHIFVSGRVQGVLFRRFCQFKAKRLGISGWVRNLADGRVEITAEGEKEKIEEFIKRAKKGLFLARVDNLEVNFEEYRGEFRNFEIINNN